jgi:hypothetical protein
MESMVGSPAAWTEAVPGAHTSKRLKAAVRNTFGAGDDLFFMWWIVGETGAVVECLEVSGSLRWVAPFSFLIPTELSTS